MSLRPTPGFLRGEVVAQIIHQVHSAAQGGPWAIEAVWTSEQQVITELRPPEGNPCYPPMVTTIKFVVGTIYPETDRPTADRRPRLIVTVYEDTGC